MCTWHSPIFPHWVYLAVSCPFLGHTPNCSCLGSICSKHYCPHSWVLVSSTLSPLLLSLPPAPPAMRLSVSQASKFPHPCTQSLCSCSLLRSLDTLPPSPSGPLFPSSGFQSPVLFMSPPLPRSLLLPESSVYSTCSSESPSTLSIQRRLPVHNNLLALPSTMITSRSPRSVLPSHTPVSAFFLTWDSVHYWL